MINVNDDNRNRCSELRSSLRNAARYATGQSSAGQRPSSAMEDARRITQQIISSSSAIRITSFMRLPGDLRPSTYWSKRPRRRRESLASPGKHKVEATEVLQMI